MIRRLIARLFRAKVPWRDAVKVEDCDGA